MTPDAWQRIKTIFDSVVDLPTVEQAAAVRAACGEEGTVREEVERLLRGHAEAGTFLAEPLLKADPFVTPKEAASADSKSPGDSIGPYRILSVIGKGGMGEVYRATDTRMGRDVAIKIVSERFSERLDHEVRTIAALNHPNICTVYDVGPNYLVMEYLQGNPLTGPLPESEVIKKTEQIISALEAAHARGIVHRDLKPANILVMGDRLKLLDFGVARFSLPMPAPNERLATLTMSPGVIQMESLPSQSATLAEYADDVARRVLSVAGSLVGTPAYMSPEQSLGGSVDARSDIFSFGVVVYELISGRRPFNGDTMISLLGAIQKSEAPPFEASRPLKSLILKCLEKSPADRYQSVAEIRHSLEKVKAAQSDHQPSIAVLPFTMVGVNPEGEYFSEGLTDDVISALSSVNGLKVIARTSIFAFKGRTEDVRSIGETLGVTHLLEGSVRMAGNRIRVLAQLVAAADGTQLWSRRYDRDVTDVFKIQEELSNEIAVGLRLTFTGREKVKAPTHFEAYEAVLEGRHHFLRFDPANQAKALSCFQRALSIDPTYAAAHTGLALFHWGQMVVGVADPRTTMEESVEAAREGLRLDPLNSECHHTLASFYAVHEHNWAAAEQQFKRAIELNPNSPWAYHCKTQYLLAPCGRLEEALADQEQALALDPLSPPVRWCRAVLLECLHKYELEEDAIQRLDELDRNFVAGQWLLVRLRCRQGRFDEGIEIAERLVRNAGRWGMPLGALGTAYASTGRLEEAERILAELQLEHNRESARLYSSFITAAMGRYDDAFRFLAEAIRYCDPLMLVFLRGSSFEKMREDARFNDLWRMLNIPA
jgi:eukaryotic-like serine/threonine-protein kinase